MDDYNLKYELIEISDKASAEQKKEVTTSDMKKVYLEYLDEVSDGLLEYFKYCYKKNIKAILPSTKHATSAFSTANLGLQLSTPFFGVVEPDESPIYLKIKNYCNKKGIKITQPGDGVHTCIYYEPQTICAPSGKSFAIEAKRRLYETRQVKDYYLNQFVERAKQAARGGSKKLQFSIPNAANYEVSDKTIKNCISDVLSKYCKEKNLNYTEALVGRSTYIIVNWELEK